MTQTFPIKLDDPALLAQADELFNALEATSQKYISKNAPDCFSQFQMIDGLRDAIELAALASSEPVRWLVERNADFAY